MAKLVRPIRASGAVVARGEGKEKEFLVIHRRRYDDWSLPKGKAETNEQSSVTAVREIREETGYQVRLSSPLTVQHYKVHGRPKQVSWWLAHATDHDESWMDNEADKVEWWPWKRVKSKLSYDSDIALVKAARKMEPVTPLLVVRHAKALSRGSWEGNDWERGLTKRGVRQADALADCLAAFGVTSLVSSTATRCMNTVEPYANRTHITIQREYNLSEEGAQENPSAVAPIMSDLVERASQGDVVAVCGHRPVFPEMLRAAGLPKTVLVPAATLIGTVNSTREINQTLYIASKL